MSNFVALNSAKRGLFTLQSLYLLQYIVCILFTCVLQARGEKAVREEFPDAIILRPSDIYGHEDKYFNYYSCKFTSIGIPYLY